VPELSLGEYLDLLREYRLPFYVCTSYWFMQAWIFVYASAFPPLGEYLLFVFATAVSLWQMLYCVANIVIV